MFTQVVEPVYLLTPPIDKQMCPTKVDARIEEIEKRPRRRVDIFLSQQRTKEHSFRVDVLNEEDPHYAIRFANLPVQLVQCFITLDMECGNFKMIEASDFLTAVFGCLHPRLFDLTSDHSADFIRHASHAVNPSRDMKSLGSVQQWFGLVEKFFNVKVWLIDVGNEFLWSSNKLYTNNKILNIVVVKKHERWFSLLHHNEDLNDGVMTSKEYKHFLSRLSDLLQPVDVAVYSQNGFKQSSGKREHGRG